MPFRVVNNRSERWSEYIGLSLRRMVPNRYPAVAVMPRASDNAYFDQIYGGWSEHAVILDHLTTAKLVRWGCIKKLHLHWDEHLFPFERPEVGLINQNTVEALRARKGRIAFTVHNSIPHAYLDNPAAITHFRKWRQYLFGQSDVVHVHSRAARDEILQDYDIASEQVHVVPHPSYAGAFTPAQTTVLPRDRRRFLGFGSMRLNKGIPNLLAAFRQVEVPGKNIELHLAGRGGEAFMGADLGQNRLILSPNFIADADVPALFADAEFCVFGFDSALTSGSLMLALTLGKPVIVPRFASLMEVFEGAPAPLSYTPGDVSELTAVLTRAAGMQDSEIAALADQSRAIAARYDPMQISRALQAVVCGTR